MKRPILYILGISLLTMPYPAYTAFSPPQYCTFLQKLFNKCPVVQKPNLTAPQPKNIPVVQKPNLTAPQPKNIPVVQKPNLTAPQPKNIPVVQKPNLTAPQPKNIPVVQKKSIQIIPTKFNNKVMKIQRTNSQNMYELHILDKTAGNNSLASDLLNINQNNILFNPVENATVPTKTPKRKLIKIRR